MFRKIGKLYNVVGTQSITMVMNFKPLIEVPHYEFEPLLPEVRDKIKAWRREDAKASKSKKLQRVRKSTKKR